MQQSAGVTLFVPRIVHVIVASSPGDIFSKLECIRALSHPAGRRSRAHSVGCEDSTSTPTIVEHESAHFEWDAEHEWPKCEWSERERAEPQFDI